MNQEYEYYEPSLLVGLRGGLPWRQLDTGYLRRRARPWRLARTRGGCDRRLERQHGRVARARAALDGKPGLSKSGLGLEEEDDLFVVAPSRGYRDDDVLDMPQPVCHRSNDVVSQLIASVTSASKENHCRPGKRRAADSPVSPGRPRTRRRPTTPARHLTPLLNTVAAARTTLPEVTDAKSCGDRQHFTEGAPLFDVPCPKAHCTGRVREVDQPRLEWLERPRLAVPAQFYGPSEGERGLVGLFCPMCDACGGVRVAERWTRLEPLLRAGDERTDGWWQVRSPADRIALYVLSQYVYGERERSTATGEHCWLPVPLDDWALLLWVSGEAVGFASLKRRGQLIDGGPEYFMMDVLDTVFVRRAWRRRGHTRRLLERLLSERAGVRLGLSQLVPAMWRLLCGLLAHLPTARSSLFLVRWAACEGFRMNVWQALRRHVQGQVRADGSLDVAGATKRLLGGDWPRLEL